MTVAVQQPSRTKKDPLEVLAQGLGIAQSITGIRTNMAALDDHKMRQEEIEQKKADMKKGVITGAEEAKLRSEGAVDAQPGQAGAIPFTRRAPDGTESPLWLATRPKNELKAPSERAQEYAGKDGKPRIGRYVEGKGLVTSDADTMAYVKPEKPTKDLSVQERNTLQTQYDKDQEVRLNKEVFGSYKNAVELVKNPSPAADLALVYSYMKANDPGSVVRETEAETAAALGGLQERAKAQYAKMAGSGSLSDAQRQDMLAQIKSKAQIAAKSQTALDKQFSDLGTRRDVSSQDLRFANQPSFDDSKTPKQLALEELQRRKVDISNIKELQQPANLTPEQQYQATEAMKMRSYKNVGK